MEKIQINSKFADKNGEIMIIDLSGHVDQSNSLQLQKTFDDIIDSNVFKIIVNFQNLNYMSSAGWGIFVGEVKRFRENGGDIKLASMNPEINDVYQMLEFYHILDDYNTVDEASAAFAADDEVLDIVAENDGVKELPSMESKVESDEDEEIDLTDDGESDSDDQTESPKTKDKVKEKPKEKPKDKADVIEMIPSVSSTRSSSGSKIVFNPIKTDVKLSDLPVAEKVKKIISENPIVTLFQIKKIMSHDHFGNTKIGTFRLWRLLRALDLNTKEKRYRYYRSC